MPEILNSTEAAELMRMSVPAIRGMASSGEVPATQIGDDWRFLRSHLIDYISNRAIAEQRIRKEQHTLKKAMQDDQAPMGRGRPKKIKVDLAAYQ
ncbi:MAG: helix-turn-helix domain-containing protein [Gallionella sp.]|jgi:excisionase family DNA binding protein